MTRVNEFGQPVGDASTGRPAPRLGPVTLTGRTCRLEPLDEAHVEGLYAALCVDSPPAGVDLHAAGPFDGPSTRSRVRRPPRLRRPWSRSRSCSPTATPVGIAPTSGIDHANGTAEVGYITYASALQRTTAATEAMYLMAAHAFDVVGVRRYEWKCDSLNAAVRRAAARLGFTYEGVFRQALVVKGRNRDTAWFAITDHEWPRLKAALRALARPGELRRARTSAAPTDQRGVSDDKATTQTDERPGSPARRSSTRASTAGAGCSTSWSPGSRRVTSTPAPHWSRKIAEAADEANHHPDVDLRYPHLTIIAEEPRRRARSPSATPPRPQDQRAGRRGRGQCLDRRAPTSRDRPGHPRPRAGSSRSGLALLGYDTDANHDDDLRDRAGRNPTLWFQETDSEAPDRQRFHLDVSVPARRRRRRGIQAALDAGGTLVNDEAAPAFWVRGRRRRQPGLHLHLAGPSPSRRGRLTGTDRARMRDARPTIRDGWHTELSAERRGGMLCPCVLRFSYARDA